MSPSANSVESSGTFALLPILQSLPTTERLTEPLSPTAVPGPMMQPAPTVVLAPSFTLGSTQLSCRGLVGGPSRWSASCGVATSLRTGFRQGSAGTHELRWTTR